MGELKPTKRLVAPIIEKMIDDLEKTKVEIEKIIQALKQILETNEKKEEK